MPKNTTQGVTVKNGLQKVLILLCALCMSVLVLIPLSSAQLFQVTSTDTVILLVEADLLDSEQELAGLATRSSNLDTTNLANRINNYAELVQSRLQRTQTAIIPVPARATVSEISSLLANLSLYELEVITGRVSGVVLIGDVPLPQVQDDGQLFTSVYPYTDFIAPRYVFDQTSGQFIKNQETNQPELWHGIIRFAAEAEYAEFFDKIQLQANNELTDELTNRIKYINPQEEANSLNQDLVPMYGSYLSVEEDRAYNRYSRATIAQAKVAVAQNLELNRQQSENEIIQEAYAKLTATLSTDADRFSPDIYAGQQMSNYIKPAVALLSGFYNRAVPQLEQIGRYYFDREELEFVFSQISELDAYQELYFKALNQTIANKVMQIAELAQQDIEIYPGYRVVANATIDDEEVSSGFIYLINHRIKEPVADGVLNSIRPEREAQLVQAYANGRWLQALSATGFFLGFPIQTIPTLENLSLSAELARNEELFFGLGELHINGTPSSQISTAEQCRVHLGSEDGQLVETIRNYQIFDPETPTSEPQLTCFLPWEAGQAGRFIEDTVSCDPFIASNVRDVHRPRIIENGSNALVTHQACYSLRTPQEYFQTELEQIPSTDVSAAQDLIVVSAEGIAITLADVLRAQNPNIDTNNHQEWSAAVALLASGQAVEVTVQPTPNNGLRVPTPVRVTVSGAGEPMSVPSIIEHNEPNNQTLNQHLQEGVAFDLPIDASHWVSFAGRDGKSYEIVFPNAFTAGSRQELQRQLRQTEVRLAQLIDQDISGRLTQLIGSSETVWNSGQSRVTQASPTTLDELFSWQQSDLISKYQAAFRHIIQPQSALREIIPPEVAEIAVANLSFNDELLELNLPNISRNLVQTPAPTVPASPLQQNSTGQTAINQNELRATPACQQYQSTASAVRIIDYVQYLDCWIENEIEASIDSFVELPSQFGLDFSSENIPRQATAITQVRVQTDPPAVYAGVEGFEAIIQLLDAQNRRVIGTATSLTVELAEGATFADGTTSKELFTIRGEVRERILISEVNTTEVTAQVRVGNLVEQLRIPVLSPPEIRLEPQQIPAGSTATITLAYTKTDSREPTPNTLQISTAAELGLAGTYTINQDGSFTAGIQAPQQAGVQEITIVTSNGSEFTTQLEVVAGTPQNVFFTDRASSVVAKQTTTVPIALFDQFGNLVQSAESITIRQTGGTQFATIPTASLISQNGQVQMSIQAAEPVGVVTLEVTAAGRSFSLAFLSTNQTTLTDIAELDPYTLFAQITHNLNETQVQKLTQSWLSGSYLQAVTTESSVTNPAVAGDPFYGSNELHNHLLKVGASNPIGLAHQNNAGANRLVWGDPTFALAENEKQQVDQYTSDIGELIATTQTPITHLVAQKNQIALGHEDGQITTLVRGETPRILSTLPLGIKELTWWTPQANQEPVLIATTKEQCSPQQGCMFAFSFNRFGKLERNPLQLEFTGKPQRVVAVDLTQDGREDILLVDEEGKLLLFPNVAGQAGRELQKNGVLIAHTGQVIDTDSNQAGFVPIQITSGVQPRTGAAQFTVSGQSYTFITDVTSITNPQFTLTDENGAPVQLGDTIEYQLQFTTQLALNNARIALPLGRNFTVDLNSVDCSGCEVMKTRDSQYGYALTGVNAAAGQVVTISFKAEARTLVTTNPQIQIVRDEGGYPADGQPDIAVVIPGQQFRTIYYSAQNAAGNIVYQPFQHEIGEVTADETTTGVAAEIRERQNALQSGNQEEIARGVTQQYNDFSTLDQDGDGLVDSLRTELKNATDIANRIGDQIENFFCSTGCLALPVNYAFLVDGITQPFNAVPVYGISGLPPYVYFGQSALFGTFFRNYLSPTLTGEVAMALCFGPYPVAGCSAFQLFGLHNFGDLCESINATIIDVMQGAVDTVQTGIDTLNEESGLAAAGVTVNLSASGQGGPPGLETKTTVKVPGFPGVLTNWLSAQWLEITDVVDLPDINIVYPDFSGAFGTDTDAELAADAQNQESENQEAENQATPQPQPDVLTEAELNAIEDEDLRAVARELNGLNNTLQATVLSGQAGLAEAEAGLNELHEYFNDVAEETLLKIESENFEVKYPYLDAKEINQFMNQLTDWYANLQKEVDVALSSWGCYADTFANLADTDLYDIEAIERELFDGGTLKAEFSERIEQIPGQPEQKPAAGACIELMLAWGGISAAVNENLEILGQYLDLPYLIIEIDNFEAKYAGAIQGYLDQVNGFIFEWLNGNTERLKAWQNTIKKLREIWGDISFLLNISLDYTKQCSDCRTDRFSNFSALIEFFVKIPEPPVIDLPKLPNVTLDFANIQPGATLKVPTFTFIPEPVSLPSLPQVQLPDAPPANLSAAVPQLGALLNVRLPQPPGFDDLAALLEFPDLPEVQLPKLPLLPLPPDVEQLNLSVMADIKASLEFVSEVLRIICLIEKAGFPVAESALKEKIEQITARPITPILPIDIAAGIGFELPDLPTFRYLKELKVVGSLTLNLEADLLTELIGSVVEEINQFSSDFTNSWDEQIQRFNTSTVDILNFDHNFESVEFGYSPEELDILREFDLDFTNREQAASGLLDDLGAWIPNTNGLRLELPPSIDTLVAQGVTDQAVRSSAVNTDVRVTLPPGIYVEDEVTGNVGRAMQFAPIILEDLHFAFSDFDQDNDPDLVYALGNEVFIKRNTRNEHSTEFSRAEPELLNYNELIANSTPATSTAFVLENSESTANVTAPVLQDDQIAIIEVAPSGRERQPNQAKYIMVPSEDVLTDVTLEQDQFGWRKYVGSSRRVEFTGFEITRGADADLFVRVVAPQTQQAVTLPHVDEETTYYVSIQTITENAAEVVTNSNQLLTISQLQCSDQTPPRAGSLAGKVIDVIVYQPVEISLAEAEDSNGSVQGFYLDTNPTVDSDNDGIPNNDRIVFGDSDPEVDSNFDGITDNDPDLSEFTLSAFDQPGERQITAGLLDSAGNETIVPITIRVLVPAITVSQSNETTVGGFISPGEPNVPLELIRERNGQVEVLAEVETDGQGRFSTDTLTNKQTIIISRQETEAVAEIGLGTGAVVHDDSVRTVVIPHSYRGEARIEIQEREAQANSQTVTTIMYQPTGLNDVAFFDTEPDLSPDANHQKDQVYVWDVDDQDNYRWQFLANDDPGFPGAAVLTKDGVRTAIITPTGDMYAEGPINFVLDEVASPFAYQPISIREGITPVAKVLITVNQVQIIPYQSEQTGAGGTTEIEGLPTEPDTRQIPFSDLAEDDPDAELIAYLQERFIVSGRIREGERVAALESTMTRAEYIKTLLTMMCIEPREGAYRQPDVFADITQTPGIPMPWFYPYTKEGFLQGFISGYEGNIDPVTGLPIFLPNNDISIAEAAKIVLEVMESQELIDISNVQPSEIWYESFVDVAQNLSPYLQAPTAAESFILTAEEAADPTRSITRREFFRIVDRVLTFSNCLDADDDNDGLPNYFDQFYNLGDANDDPDQDRLTNLQEFRLGTNPLDPDTDDGGVQDGTEVFRGTDPLDSSDDLPGQDQPTRGGLIQEYPCVTCPCEYRITYSAELIATDQIFAVLKDGEGAIIQRSNSITPRFNQ